MLFVLIGLFGCNKVYEFFEEDTIVCSEKFELDAKITLPKTKKLVPAVVLVHGSGAADMDETCNQLKPFKNLAEELAKKGIATIRYDKITNAYMEEVVQDYNFTIYDKVINDALAAVNIMKNDPRIDSENIFILGHSLGGQLAPVILNENKNIKGAIMLAGTPEHLLDVLMEQIRRQSEELYEEYLPHYNYIRNLKKVVKGEEKLLFFGGYQKYWVNYNLIDIKEETIRASNNHPLLIMQGGKDLQVDGATLDLYKEILKDSNNVVYKFYKNLNHCFVDGVGETIETAYSVKKDIPSVVINDISKFINESRK